jgi:long-chain acyl-CoA synthetase
MSIAAALHEAAQQRGDRTALVYLGSAISFSRLSELVDRAAAGLQELGVRRGDRVVVYLPNTPQWVVVWAALQQSGAIAVPVTPFYGARELAYICRDAGARVVLCTDVNYSYVAAAQRDADIDKVVVTGLLDLLPAWKRAVGRLLSQVPRGQFPTDEHTVAFPTLLKAGRDGSRAQAGTPESLVEILYTGGTTGEAKGVPISQEQLRRSMREQRRQSEEILPFGEDVVLQGAPLYHILGQAVGLAALLSGDTLILLPRMNLDAVLDHIQRFNARTLFGVPAFFRMILEHDRRDDYDLSSLRYCFSGGDVLPVEVGRRWEERYGLPILQGYGATETCGGISLTPLGERYPPGTVGKILTLHEVRLVQPGETEPVRPAEPGELLVHSEHMVREYWNNPAETERSFVDLDGKRWYRTGDIVRIDEDGWVFFEDRSADTIKHKGYRVAASRVEAALLEHPAVLAACVVGVPDERVGERVKALVVMKVDAVNIHAQDLSRWCRERLAPYERPSSIEFRDMLPKSKVGKLLRREIRDEERRRRQMADGDRYTVGSPLA